MDKAFRRTGFAIVALFAALLAYLRFIRPRQLRWGATDEETARRMPGDAVVPNPTFNATRAVTVNAPPEDIFPWILQMGYGRGGFYSYDWIDNGRKPSANEIIPELQRLHVGDKIPLSPYTSMTVRAMEPNVWMLWDGNPDEDGETGTWAWGLYPIDETRTRLVTRLRSTYRWWSLWLPLVLLVDVGDVVMMRKCLLGIKRRAEARYAQRTQPVISDNHTVPAYS